MSDKSPRQSASKKSEMSIKEKRAVKKSRKATAQIDQPAEARGGPRGGRG